MEAVKLIEQFWGYLKHLGIYAQYCVESDMRAPVCRDFWIATAITACVIALLIALVIVKGIVKEQREFSRNRKRLEARAIVADSETMNRYAWKGDDLAVDLSSEDLAAEIRKATRANSSSSDPT